MMKKVGVKNLRPGRKYLLRSTSTASGGLPKHIWREALLRENGKFSLDEPIGSWPWRYPDWADEIYELPESKTGEANEPE